MPAANQPRSKADTVRALEVLAKPRCALVRLYFEAVHLTWLLLRVLLGILCDFLTGNTVLSWEALDDSWITQHMGRKCVSVINNKVGGCEGGFFEDLTRAGEAVRRRTLMTGTNDNVLWRLLSREAARGRFCPPPRGFAGPVISTGRCVALVGDCVAPRLAARHLL
jgi:hypothetical protein